jgi:rubrerythrin
MEMQNLKNRENEMYKLYDELMREIKNPEIRKQIQFIRDQELGHVQMATSIISILREEMAKG